ncbi:MAG TPA: MBL fold metallo-hydrolase [Candidatus Binatia bacterium]|nr:MBL fold metallo-hydrolase [Candidatus Binatia bacterium]
MTAIVLAQRALPATASPMRIIVADMGQADATLVLKDDKTLLIDAGEVTGTNSRKFTHLADLLRDNMGTRKTIDYVVITHYHMDHMGKYHKYANGTEFSSGLFGIVEESGYKIGTLIDRGNAPFAPQSEIFTNYLARTAQWLTDGRLGRRITATVGTGQIDLGPEVTVRIAAVNGAAGNGKRVHDVLLEQQPSLFDDCPPSENDFSVAMEISQGKFEFFTAGDLTGNAEDEPYLRRSFGSGSCTMYTNIEQALLDERVVDDVEVYRADHHGSGHSSSPKFLEALDPEFTVISCGGGYDHPEHDVSLRMARTSWLVVTDGVSAQEWPNGFEIRKSDIVGDVDIEVKSGGGCYRINNQWHRAYSDGDERGGDDKGEERRPGSCT